VFFRLLVRGFVFNERFVPADHRQRVETQAQSGRWFRRK